ncbi:MAG: hypothetical protein HeimC3_47150 [Candidatus Heimdallarchaeota archaeon LC_3]|nr:MAG: hypothetical protein HeimC3_47150 [Candidatus Heimdallarchaeota archaeon LC_3]
MIGIAQILFVFIGNIFLGPWVIDIGLLGKGIIGYSGVIMRIASYTLMFNLSFFKKTIKEINFSILYVVSNFLGPILGFLLYVVLDVIAYLFIHDGGLPEGIFLELYLWTFGFGNAYLGHLLGFLLGFITYFVFKIKIKTPRFLKGK